MVVEIADGNDAVEAVVLNEEDVLAQGEEPVGVRKYRGFVFTCNNYSREDVEFLKAQDTAYIVFGFETAPTTGTNHLQGYVHFRNRRSLAGMWDDWGEKFWIRAARGSGPQNRKYCVKGGNFFEAGECPKDRGAETKLRWSEAFRLSENGDFKDIEPDIRFRYYSTIHRIRDDFLSQQQLSDNVVFLHQLYYGVYGTGKSYRAKMLHGKENVFMKLCNKWWDGYSFQPVVIIDDICPEQAAYMTYFLKIWLDERPFMCEIKRRATKIRPKKFILTSNYSPEELWPKEQDRLAILDRLTVTRFTELDRMPNTGRNKVSDRQLLMEGDHYGVPVNLDYVCENRIRFSLPHDWGIDRDVSYQEPDVE